MSVTLQAVKLITFLREKADMVVESVNRVAEAKPEQKPVQSNPAKQFSLVLGMDV